MKVFIIAEDQQVISDISFCLKVRYPDIDIISAAEELKVIQLIPLEIPDLVILDFSIHKIDTLGLIYHIRQFTEVPLLVLSQNETDLDRARGLEAGADEYISKPFSPIELIARYKALMRRAKGLSFVVEKLLSIADLTIDFANHEALLFGKPLKLTPMEYGLLSELAKNEGKLVTSNHLLETVWGPEYSRDPQLIKTYVYRLRTKLQPSYGKSVSIKNERGLGYRFVRCH
jgi:two-component system KDP operon response regulator KdpE